MKACALIFLLINLIASPVAARDRVEQFVASDSVLVILDGNWLQPEDGGYRIVMTDSNVTVNGYEYVHPEVIVRHGTSSKMNEFIAWLADTTYKVAQQMIVEGGDAEDARAYMNQVFSKYSNCDSFRLEIDKYGNFMLYPKRGYPVPLIMPVPKHPPMPKTIPSYRSRFAEPIFGNLVSALNRGNLVMRGTRNGSIVTFPASLIDHIKQELKQVPKRARVRMVIKDRTLYEPIEIMGNGALASSDIDLLVNPRKLIRR